MRCLVLLADSDQDRLESRMNFLGDHGFHCISAKSGTEALATAANYKPHVVILLESLAEIEGTDVCLRIKQEAETNHARVMILGKDAGQEEKFIGGEVGADAFVDIGISDSELLQQIHDLLRIPLSDA